MSLHHIFMWISFCFCFDFISFVHCMFCTLSSFTVIFMFLVFILPFHFTHSILFTGILFSAASSIFTVMSVMIVICHFVFIHVVSFHFTYVLFMSLHTVRKSIHQPANQPINHQLITQSINQPANQPCRR